MVDDNGHCEPTVLFPDTLIPEQLTAKPPVGEALPARPTVPVKL